MLKLRRFVTAATVLVLIGALPAAPAAGQGDLPPGGTFIDDDGSVHEPAIEAIVAAGLTVGCTDDRYCPQEPVTRGQMASFLARALPGLDPATRDWFGDDDVNVHEANINVIAENGITIGFSDGTFRPQIPVTRGQMATFLARALGLDPVIPPVPMPTTVYFFLGSLGDDPLGQGGFLVPVHRRIAATTMPATFTMRALLEGPTSDEAASIPPISTEVPPSTELLGIAIADGVATVDLSGAFASGGGSASMLGRVAQVVFTLTQYSTVDEVAFELDGDPIDVLGGEGIILEDYNSREELFDQLPLVFVDRPSYGGEAANPVRVVGWTAAFEATFEVAVVDADGLIVTEQTVTASGEQISIPDGPLWTSFDVDVPYAVDTPQTGALIAWAVSAKDGTQIAVREYPVQLEPAG